MNIRLILAVLFLFALHLNLFSQHHVNKKKMLEAANQYYNAEEYMLALPLYEKLDTLSPNDGEIKYKLGVCYYNSHHKIRCLPYFLKAKHLGYFFPGLDYYIARGYHLNHEFDKAIYHYTFYKSSLSDSSLILETDREIAMCRTGKELVADSLELIIENMGPDINTKYPDYAPVVSADETVMIFTSRRPNTTGGDMDPEDGMYYEDVYISYKDSTGKWSEPVDMGPHVNSKYHDASVGMSPDGQKLFIYRSGLKKNAIGDVFVSNLEGDHWSAPVIMDDGINSDHWEPSVTISADEKTIYFSSDRPGGFGGTDLYLVRMQENGHWGTPENLGPSINTEFDEDAPYIHPDGKTLFFSSKGHKTMGGFDIFTTVFDGKKNEWGKPENIGYPINTADDDIYFMWSSDGTEGYFSSWRDDSYGDKDVYIIHRPKGSTNLIVMKGKVLDGEGKVPVGATIMITDLETKETKGIFNSNSVTGNYTVVLPHGKNYALTIEAPGYVFYSENFNIPENNPFFCLKKNINLDPVKVGSKIVLNNIFFDFDNATLRKESFSELKKIYNFMDEYPDVKVEISGHTDNYGKDKYNQRLSEKRAYAVVQFLISKGISKDRLVAKGYGESEPIAGNETGEGRQMNRRTELKIIDKDQRLIQYYNDIQIEYVSQYQDAKPNEVNQKGQKKNSKSSRLFWGEDGPPVNSVLRSKVHFIQNDSKTITEYSQERILNVVHAMKVYPTMKLKIVAYADNSSDNEYNKKLSENRARSVYDFMIEHGADPARLIYEAKDEKDTAGNEKKESDEMKNRRVEFIVSGYYDEE